jgi:hypothetical protein
MIDQNLFSLKSTDYEAILYFKKNADPVLDRAAPGRFADFCREHCS